MLVYDEAEVRKIVRAARWVMDRLGLVEGVTSPRGLVVSFKVLSLKLILFVIIINVKVFSFNCFLCLKLLTKLLLKETSNTTEDWTINKVVPFFRELVRPFSIYHTSE